MKEIKWKKGKVWIFQVGEYNFNELFEIDEKIIFFHFLFIFEG